MPPWPSDSAIQPVAEGVGFADAVAGVGVGDGVGERDGDGLGDGEGDGLGDGVGADGAACRNSAADSGVARIGTPANNTERMPNQDAPMVSVVAATHTTR